MTSEHPLHAQVNVSFLSSRSVSMPSPLTCSWALNMKTMVVSSHSMVYLDTEACQHSHIQLWSGFWAHWNDSSLSNGWSSLAGHCLCVWISARARMMIKKTWLLTILDHHIHTLYSFPIIICFTQSRSFIVSRSILRTKFHSILLLLLLSF